MDPQAARENRRDRYRQLPCCTALKVTARERRKGHAFRHGRNLPLPLVAAGSLRGVLFLLLECERPDEDVGLVGLNHLVGCNREAEGERGYSTAGEAVLYGRKHGMAYGTYLEGWCHDPRCTPAQPAGAKGV